MQTVINISVSRQLGKKSFRMLLSARNCENVWPARSSETKAIKFRFSLSRQTKKNLWKNVRENEQIEQSMTEIAVFKVSTSFTSKIKKFAVSPKEVKFFLLSSYVLGNPQVKCFLWWPFGDQLQGRREDFVIEGAYRQSIQWHYGHNSAYQDCEQGTFLGRFGCILLRENFWDWSSLRCNLVYSGCLNLANAWIPFWTCNSEIFNKPKRGGGPGPTPKSALELFRFGHQRIFFGAKIYQ